MMRTKRALLAANELLFANTVADADNRIVEILRLTFAPRQQADRLVEELLIRHSR